MNPRRFSLTRSRQTSWNADSIIPYELDCKRVNIFFDAVVPAQVVLTVVRNKLGMAAHLTAGRYE
jgi:hypothetical protein